MKIESIGSFDETGLYLKNPELLDPVPHIRELLIEAESLYRSGSTSQDQAKRQLQCVSESDTSENLSPLGAFLLALEHSLLKA